MNQDNAKFYDGRAGIFEMGQYDSRFDHLKTSSFDPRTLWDRVNGDIELLRELVGIFTDEYPGLLKSIAAAIEQNSFDDVRKMSHKLKGSALQFSGSRAAALAAALERMGQDRSLQSAAGVLHNLEQEIVLLVKALRTMTSEKGEPAH